MNDDVQAGDEREPGHIGNEAAAKIEFGPNMLARLATVILRRQCEAGLH
ncbi:hypothetical protein [Thiomonas sp.]|nr:hypothetical protein [Thiomonas sp.]